MTWLVSLLLANGQVVTLNVMALDKSAAEYRAADKAETIHGSPVVRVTRCVRGYTANR